MPRLDRMTCGAKRESDAMGFLDSIGSNLFNTALKMNPLTNAISSIAPAVPGLDKVFGGGGAEQKADTSQIAPQGKSSGFSLGNLFGGGGGGIGQMFGALAGLAKAFIPGAGPIVDGVMGFVGGISQLFGGVKAGGAQETPEETKAGAQDAIGQARDVLGGLKDIKAMIGQIPRTAEGQAALEQVGGMLRSIPGMTQAPQPAPAGETLDQTRASAEGSLAKLKELQQQLAELKGALPGQ